MGPGGSRTQVVHISSALHLVLMALHSSTATGDIPNAFDCQSRLFTKLNVARKG